MRGVKFVVILMTILVYLLSMMIIGCVYSKKNRNVSDFYLGGRRLAPLVSAMSAEASDMSSWLLMGLPGLAYLTGTVRLNLYGLMLAYLLEHISIGYWLQKDYVFIRRKLEQLRSLIFFFDKV